jgi:hypothetical protein
MQARILIEMEDDGTIHLQIAAPSRAFVLGVLEETKHLMLNAKAEEPKRIVPAAIVPVVPRNGRG